MATIVETITQRIEQIPEDVSFGYDQLALSREQYQTAAKALERLQKKGVIKKLSKGRFYKPKKTLFGEKRPDEEQLLKPYLYQSGKRTAYITGDLLYNQLGLTTQIPSIIKIASRARRIAVNTGAIKATAVKSYADVTEENYWLLGYLDALKDLKKIPDVDLSSALTILKRHLLSLSSLQRQSLVNYALAYPARVRALLGALLMELSIKEGVDRLRDSLNPLTTFSLGIDNQLLATASQWNIQ